MAERSKMIFENEMSSSVYKKAVKSKRKYMKKFGDDSEVSYPIQIHENPTLGSMLGVQDVRLAEVPGNTYRWWFCWIY